MRIALASDHAGFRFKTLIAQWLKERGHDVVDFGRIEVRPLEHVTNDVTAHRRPVRHVESAAPGLGKPRAGGGYDDSVGHYLSSCLSPRRKPGPKCCAGGLMGVEIGSRPSPG